MIKIRMDCCQYITQKYNNSKNFIDAVAAVVAPIVNHDHIVSCFQNKAVILNTQLFLSSIIIIIHS